MSPFKTVKRNILREMLLGCTQKQIEMFNRMYGSVDRIPETKMDRAYDQIKRTLEKNQQTINDSSDNLLDAFLATLDTEDWPQAQYSTDEQLSYLIRLAEKLKLYAGADVLKAILERK